MRGPWMRAIGNRLRHNLTTRLIILLMLALMGITGFTDYTRLVREREQLVAQIQEDARIFAETLALAVRHNLRRGRTTEELEDLLAEIVARPGLVAVAIYNPDTVTECPPAVFDALDVHHDCLSGAVLRQVFKSVDLVDIHLVAEVDELVEVIIEIVQEPSGPGLVEA